VQTSLSNKIDGTIRLTDLLLNESSVDEEDIFRAPVAVIPTYSAESRTAQPIYRYFNPRYSHHFSEDLVICSLSEDGLLDPMVEVSLGDFISMPRWWDVRQLILSPEQPEFMFWVGLAQSLGLAIVSSTPSSLLDGLGVPYALLTMEAVKALDEEGSVFRNTRSEDVVQLNAAISSLRQLLQNEAQLVDLEDASTLTSKNIDIAVAPPIKRCPVLWNSPVFEYGGYASLARTVIPLINPEKVDLQVSPIGADPKFIEQLSQNPAEISAWNRLLGQKVESGVGIRFYVPASVDDVGFFSQFRDSIKYLQYFIGFTMLEVDSIPASWVRECNSMNEVWVPSSFCARVFESSGVESQKIQVIPIGVDTVKYSSSRTPLIEKSSTFRFLSIFQWNNRKGWDVLLASYLRAFSKNDDVELVIRAYPDRFKEPPIRDRIIAELARHGFRPETAPKITIIEDFVSDHDIPRLYTSADCFVLPTRGEGLGLPFLEAMASGLPVISTGWGGHTDFLNSENSYVIEVESFSLVDEHHRRENPHYRHGMRWAEPSVNHCAALMKEVFDDRKGATVRAKRALQDVLENWSLARTALWLEERFSRIASFLHKAPAISPIVSKTATAKAAIGYSQSLHII
jgi:glycosyltransferase involved in cell wall biosynthesis